MPAASCQRPLPPQPGALWLGAPCAVLHRPAADRHAGRAGPPRVRRVRGDRLCVQEAHPTQHLPPARVSSTAIRPPQRQRHEALDADVQEGLHRADVLAHQRPRRPHPRRGEPAVPAEGRPQAQEDGQSDCDCRCASEERRWASDGGGRNGGALGVDPGGSARGLVVSRRDR
eukprot:7391922-Prymnesium_polylepis.2